MSSQILVFCPSADDGDLDCQFLAPEGMNETQAKAKAAEVHRAYHEFLTGSPVSVDDDPEWEGFIEAMKSAGFIYPKSVTGPTWDKPPTL